MADCWFYAGQKAEGKTPIGAACVFAEKKKRYKE
jgi:hypothetical protein